LLFSEFVRRNKGGTIMENFKDKTGVIAGGKIWHIW